MASEPANDSEVGKRTSRTRIPLILPACHAAFEEVLWVITLSGSGVAVAFGKEFIAFQ